MPININSAVRVLLHTLTPVPRVPTKNVSIQAFVTEALQRGYPVVGIEPIKPDELPAHLTDPALLVRYRGEALPDPSWGAQDVAEKVYKLLDLKVKGYPQNQSRLPSETRFDHHVKGYSTQSGFLSVTSFPHEAIHYATHKLILTDIGIQAEKRPGIMWALTPQRELLRVNPEILHGQFMFESTCNWQKLSRKEKEEHLRKAGKGEELLERPVNGSDIIGSFLVESDGKIVGFVQNVWYTQTCFPVRERKAVAA